MSVSPPAASPRKRRLLPAARRNQPAGAVKRSRISGLPLIEPPPKCRQCEGWCQPTDRCTGCHLARCANCSSATCARCERRLCIECTVLRESCRGCVRLYHSWCFEKSRTRGRCRCEAEDACCVRYRFDCGECRECVTACCRDPNAPDPDDALGTCASCAEQFHRACAPKNSVVCIRCSEKHRDAVSTHSPIGSLAHEHLMHIVDYLHLPDTIAMDRTCRYFAYTRFRSPRHVEELRCIAALEAYQDLEDDDVDLDEIMRIIVENRFMHAFDLALRVDHAGYPFVSDLEIVVERVAAAGWLAGLQAVESLCLHWVYLVRRRSHSYRWNERYYAKDPEVHDYNASRKLWQRLSRPGGRDRYEERYRSFAPAYVRAMDAAMAKGHEPIVQYLRTLILECDARSEAGSLRELELESPSEASSESSSASWSNSESDAGNASSSSST